MANEEHVAQLRKGVASWNARRNENRDIRPDLREANFSGADLSWANLFEANLSGANLSKAKLTRMSGLQVNFSGANLSGAMLDDAFLIQANLARANLSKTNLFRADLADADLQHAYLACSSLMSARLSGANLRGANLRPTVLSSTNLTGAILSSVDLSENDLERSLLIETDLTGADLTGCHIYGVSAWGLKLEGAKQQNLIITRHDEPEITVDNIEVAQFIYLLLHNEKIRDVIDTIGKKGVLLLGRFTKGRMVVLERLREELRKRDFLPIIFNFDKPETKNFTETVRLLAGMSRFVIVDITNPRSAPLELQATVPECMVPFVPILDKNDEQEPFAMLRDLQIAHRDRVFDVIRYPYPSVGRLIEVLDTEIIGPAQARFAELLALKAEGVRYRDV
jgi:uncharacterized protein YjbI with pentapeptide repeats